MAPLLTLQFNIFLWGIITGPIYEDDIAGGSLPIYCMIITTVILKLSFLFLESMFVGHNFFFTANLG
jgi:hypothetical protein